MLHFSFIIPVYNRPEELDELLMSLAAQSRRDFEVLVIEDGSSRKSEFLLAKYDDILNIHYFYKENSGPGDSRNFGMKNAAGNYFLILDSDCILPSNYFEEVLKALNKDYADCFGGVDAAMDSFSPVQKAINFAMTSILTTGGVRGGSEKLGKFQPRSFNMGLSKKAFEASGGFGRIHPGEDPDLSIRLWKMGFETRLFKNVSVFHKRRIDWDKFKIQVNKFGKVRPILDLWHPEYTKLTFWFPSLFFLGLVFSFLFFFLGFKFPFFAYTFYFLLCFLFSSFQNKSLYIGALSVYAVFVQFMGYGTGFLESFFKVKIQKNDPEKAFPELFFKMK